MGHTRLGRLPRTRKWIQVLDLIGDGAGTPEVAAATRLASQDGLSKAEKDPGLVHAVWLLAQVPLAAEKGNFAERLQRVGMAVSKDPSLFEITGAFTGAIDNHLRQNKGRTTFSFSLSF